MPFEAAVAASLLLALLRVLALRLLLGLGGNKLPHELLLLHFRRGQQRDDLCFALDVYQAEASQRRINAARKPVAIGSRHRASPGTPAPAPLAHQASALVESITVRLAASAQSSGDLLAHSDTISAVIASGWAEA